MKHPSHQEKIEEALSKEMVNLWQDEQRASIKGTRCYRRVRRVTGDTNAEFIIVKSSSSCQAVEPSCGLEHHKVSLTSTNQLQARIQFNSTEKNTIPKYLINSKKEESNDREVVSTSDPIIAENEYLETSLDNQEHNIWTGTQEIFYFDGLDSLMLNNPEGNDSFSCFSSVAEDSIKLEKRRMKSRKSSPGSKLKEFRRKRGRGTFYPHYAGNIDENDC
mmetsp:Transcript_50/g.78  ORF Transcript_50/g.78 Transcript_50/m.78 type:complete len:219 (-) Transcript_50:137-793(-)|eukprot:CAMPEP_0202447952 /NCGR_PEP_ID=MMETSP1360-20130828/6727_1 /ASSEMBLY_ACC=CAM_ASM_000848 /TAXON_ID=515479 /ORGANISM="Licmophora paradoxa, Strain CCMP2313" /LENGTH=218 /DNA_ID=CAMNT_0049065277 /DNA_START=212 /DNA_END=868 /DNA_ORIENTATION=+